MKDLQGTMRRSGLLVAAQEMKRALKDALDKVDALQSALLAQDDQPDNLFASLADRNGDARFLTVQDLAELLRVDRRVVYRLRGRGLPFHRIGKELRFDPLEVASWLREKQKT